MRRRDFIGFVSSATIVRSLPARAQPATPVIGFLNIGSASSFAHLVDAFRAGLKEAGFVEGQNIAIDYQLAAGQCERLYEMAAELVRLNVDIIVAAGNMAAFPAKRATRTIPIVVLGSHNGVGTGIFESLARPGENITGIESLAPDIDAKRIEILRELLPQHSRLALLYNPMDPGAASHVESGQKAAEVLSRTMTTIEVRTPSGFDAAFGEILRERPNALLVISDPVTLFGRQLIVDFVSQQGLPTIYEFKVFAELGGLISYGPSIGEMWKRGAYYVDKIRKGAKPADLPVEQPTRLELVINLKAAKTLGIIVPPSLIARADEVIE